MGALGNTIWKAVISNLTSSLSLQLKCSLPQVSLIIANAVFNWPASFTEADAEVDAKPLQALMIDCELGNHKVVDYLAFLLDKPSRQTLLERLNR